MNGRSIELSFPITKVVAEQRRVGGYATVEMPDKQGDIVDYQASIEAFQAWPGNIREQHNKHKTIGVCVDWAPMPEKKAIWVDVQLSRSTDGQDAWTKVQEGVLKGFSIGGEALKSRPDVLKSAVGERTFNRITKYRLDELSLVDNPACPDAKFELVKVIGAGVSTATAALKKMNNMDRGSPMYGDDIDLWTGGDQHPLEIVTGGGISGARYRLIGKSASGLALYVDDAHRGRLAFVVRSATGARVGSNDVQAVRKAAGPDGWMMLPGEYVIGLSDVGGALATSADGTRRQGSGAYTTRRNTYPGSLQTDESDGAYSGGPSATTPAQVRQRAGQEKLRPGLHSNDPVLDRRLNQPDRDPRSTSFDRLIPD